jgi:hypothetical protein
VVGWLQKNVSTAKADEYASQLEEVGVESVADLKDVSAEDAQRIFKPVHLIKFLREAGIGGGAGGGPPRADDAHGDGEAARAGAGDGEIGSKKLRKKRRLLKHFTVGHELLLLNTGVPH